MCVCLSALILVFTCVSFVCVLVCPCVFCRSRCGFGRVGGYVKVYTLFVDGKEDDWICVF